MTDNSENTVGGWADFSSAAFETSYPNFNNDATSEKAGTNNLSAKTSNSTCGKILDGCDGKRKNIEEMELKLENVECQTDVSKAVTDSGVDKVAQTDGTQSHADDNVKSAAGDQIDSSIEASQNKIKVAAIAEIVAEPSR